MISKEIPSGFFDTKLLALDLETTGFHGRPDPHRDRVLLVSLCNYKGTAIVLEPGPWMEQLWKALKDDNVTTVIHNASFDLRFLWALGFTGYPAHIWDTLLVERLFHAGLYIPCDLANTAFRHLNITLNKDIRDSFQHYVSGEFSEQQLTYAMQDADVLIPILKNQWDRAKENGLLETAKLENDLVPTVAQMQYIGVGFDLDTWERVKTEAIEQASKHNQTVQKLLNLSSYQLSLLDDSLIGINLNSPLKVKAALNRTGIKVDSTGAEVLKLYLARHPEAVVLQGLLDYRRYSKHASNKYEAHINPVTGRIHTDYGQNVTVTGRISSSSPNLQNIPVRTELGQRTREAFVAEPGWMLIKADYGQQEMRVLAEMTQDKNLLEVCMYDDIHAANAERIFSPNFTPDQRRISKNCGFAMAFGASPEKVATTGGVSLSIAERVVDYTHRQFPGVEIWAQQQINKVNSVGYVETIGGRKRYFARMSDNLDEFWDNQIRNMPIQGTAADMMKRAMIYIDQSLSKMQSRIVLTVHDEVVVESPESEVEDACKIILQEMLRAGEYYVKSVPTVCDTVVAPHWKK